MNASRGYSAHSDGGDKQADGTPLAMSGAIGSGGASGGISGGISGGVMSTGVTMHTASSQSAITPSAVPEPSTAGPTDSNKLTSSDVMSHPVRSPGSTEGSPVSTVPSGYPNLGMFVKLWGPTADVNVLEEFLSSQGNAHAWGFDWKATAGPTSETSGANFGVK